MERSKLLAAQATLIAGDKAAEGTADAVPVEKPPPATPMTTAWDVFDRLALPRKIQGEQRRYLQHAFYAGARAAFSGVMDALAEIEAGDPAGDQRLEQVEREIDAYFADVIRQAAVSRTGRVEVPR